MQADLLLVAALLRRGRALDRFSTALTLIAVLIGLSPLLGVAAPSPLLALSCALLLLAGLAEKYWALRVALDAELFERLAQSPERLDEGTLALDQALLRFGLQPGDQGARSWDSRCRGALGLLRRQALCLLLQVVIVLLAMLLPIFLPIG